VEEEVNPILGQGNRFPSKVTDSVKGQDNGDYDLEF
jgi:hypothetical protein